MWNTILYMINSYFDLYFMWLWTRYLLQIVFKKHLILSYICTKCLILHWHYPNYKKKFFGRNGFNHNKAETLDGFQVSKSMTFLFKWGFLYRVSHLLLMLYCTIYILPHFLPSLSLLSMITEQCFDWPNP